MKKTFVLDTNVILQTPRSLFFFEENQVVIAEVVLEELDRFKKEGSELGAHAREAARIIDDLRQKGNLLEGIKLPNGGTLRIELNYTDVVLPESWQDSKNDNRILKICKGLDQKGSNVILVTKDIFLRIKAETIGIEVQDFHAEQVPVYDEQYKGVQEVYAEDESIEKFYSQGKISFDKTFKYDSNYKRLNYQPTENEFFIVNSNTNEKHSALGIYSSGKIHKLNFVN